MNDLLLVPGQLGERYAFEREIGKGGFATVYLAQDTNLGRQVAIKVYHPQGQYDATVLSREAQILASLRHPNIVTVYDGGTLDNRPYIVMEYLAGGALREKLSAGRQPMRPQDALGLVAVLAEALDAAHEADILHLDIKPENIIFDHRGRPYLTDFGIGRVMGSDGETRQTQAMGTNNYASPEQRQGGKLTRASDIYSLGVVLFELLTHQLPLGPAAAHPQPPYSPPFPMNHPLTAAQDLVLLVCKALAVAPEYRYESASQFAQQLRDYILHASGSTGRLTPAPARQFRAPTIRQVEIREPERDLRLSESRRLPQGAREMVEDLAPVPPGTKVNSLLYSHQGLEIGVGSVVEQGVFGRGRVRLRQDATVKGDVISLVSIDVSQGVQASNLLAPEIMVRGPIRLAGSIFCRRLRPSQNEDGSHLPDNSELGGSLIFGKEFEQIISTDELGRPLKVPRQPIEVYHRPDIRIGAGCTLVAVLGDADVDIDPRQKQINTIRVSGNVTVGHSNTIRRIEGENIHIDRNCTIDEVHARGTLVIERGSRVGYVRAGRGIRLAHGVVLASPVLFADNGTIVEQGETKWRRAGRTVDLTAHQIFDHTRDDQQGSVATALIDHHLYKLYDRVAPQWLPRLQPSPFEGSGERVRQLAQKTMKSPQQEGEYLHIEMDLTPASARVAELEPVKERGDGIAAPQSTVPTPQSTPSQVTGQEEEEEPAAATVERVDRDQLPESGARAPGGEEPRG